MNAANSVNTTSTGVASPTLQKLLKIKSIIYEKAATFWLYGWFIKTTSNVCISNTFKFQQQDATLFFHFIWMLHQSVLTSHLSLRPLTLCSLLVQCGTHTSLMCCERIFGISLKDYLCSRIRNSFLLKPMHSCQWSTMKTLTTYKHRLLWNQECLHGIGFHISGFFFKSHNMSVYICIKSCKSQKKTWNWKAFAKLVCQYDIWENIPRGKWVKIPCDI